MKPIAEVYKSQKTKSKEWQCCVYLYESRGDADNVGKLKKKCLSRKITFQCMRVGGWRLGKRGKDTTEGDATKSQQTTSNVFTSG